MFGGDAGIRINCNVSSPSRSRNQEVPESSSSKTRCKKTFTVSTPFGLDMRSAAALVKQGNLYKSTIMIHGNGVEANAKSIISITLLGALKGQQVTVVTDGEDAPEAMKAIRQLFVTDFCS